MSWFKMTQEWVYCKNKKRGKISARLLRRREEYVPRYNSALAAADRHPNRLLVYKTNEEKRLGQTRKYQKYI